MITESKRRLYAGILLSSYALSLPATSFGAGVLVGNSTLFNTLDYSDTFTGTADGSANPARPYAAALQPAPAYVVENSHGNPARSFLGASFSFASDAAGTPGLVDGTPTYPIGATPNASGAGSNTGFTQTGGAVDYGLVYGNLRDVYTVQFDAVQTPDRIDISSGASLGIFGSQSISIFFRDTGGASIFNGATDTPIPGFNSGISGSGQWHNYAVTFDRPNNSLEIFVNEISRGTINLNTFNGGTYSAGFSNNVVSVGGAGGNRVWTDNFQIGGMGAPRTIYADPGNIAGLPSSLTHYWDFNEGDGSDTSKLLDFAYDRQGSNDGSFLGTVERVPGLVGLGAAKFNDVDGDAISVGADNFSFTNGISVEAIVTTTWDGSDQAEFFRKEDGNNRILFSFQAGTNINNASGQLVGTAGTPGISFGINAGGYGELDIAFDGLDGRPTLAQVADGNPHHFVATFNAATGLKEIYMDGNLIGFVDLANGLSLVTGGAADARIGASGGIEPFAGVIDEVAIYSEALSASEIAAHFASVQAGGNYFFIPEPGSLSLLLSALLGLAFFRRRRD